MTANVNGIRAALRRGGLSWLARSGAHLIGLQEVRANPDQVSQALAEAGMGDWHLALAPAVRPGRSGVALLSRTPLHEVTSGLDPQVPAGEGRWIEATVADPHGGPGIRVASAYVPKGQAEGVAREAKDRFLSAVGTWLTAHRERPALLFSDLNVAHTAADLKNWRGNRGRPGFLESERAHLDRWYAPTPDGLGWTDLGRHFGGPGPGPFSWWSWRGQAFDNDAGWRIDVVAASPPMAARATGSQVHKSPTYAERWSDHAAVSATFR